MLELLIRAAASPGGERIDAHLAGEAAAHGLAPLLGAHVAAGRLVADTPAVAASLARARSACLAAELVGERAVRDYLGALDAFVFLKGAALVRAGVYAPGTRPMHDLDVLVPRAAFARALATARAHGGRPFWPFARPLTRRLYHELDVVFDGRVAVDLHRGLSAWPLFRDPPDLFARAAAHVPAPVDLFVTVAMHAAQDGFAVPARTIVDGLLLLARVDRASIESRARAFAATRATARWLRILDSLAGWTPLPHGKQMPRAARFTLAQAVGVPRWAAFAASRASLRVVDRLISAV